MQEPPQLLKAKDVAKRLNVSLAMAYRLMQSGKLRSVHFGRSVRVLEEDLKEFILECRSDPGLLN
jgi:excisionase family DNA binding protein